MNLLGNGLSEAELHEEALSVREAELSMKRRLGVSEERILISLNNLANTYHLLGRFDEVLSMRRDVYSECCKLKGEEHRDSLRAALNYTSTLTELKCFEEAKALLRKSMPVARRALGESDDITLSMRWVYAKALYGDPGATLDDLRGAVETLEDAGRIARRVFGSAHPTTTGIEASLRKARATFAARAYDAIAARIRSAPRDAADD
jgi:hypothetical protein